MDFQKTLSRTLFKLKMFTADILKSSFIEDKTVMTASVSRRDHKTVVRYNPDYFENLESDELRAAALTHEMLHPMMKHHLRAEDLRSCYSDQAIQMAADLEINPMIVDMGLPLHPDWIYDKKYHGMAMEEIIKDLEPEGETDGGGDDGENNDGSEEGGDDGAGIPADSEQSETEASTDSGSNESAGDSPKNAGDDAAGELPPSNGEKDKGLPDNRNGDSNADEPANNDAEQSGNAPPDDKKGSGQSANRPAITAPADIEPYQSHDAADRHEEQQKCEQAFINACVQAQMAGELPAGMKRILEELTQPQIDWSIQLQEFMTECYPEDYSYRKPHECFSCLLPTLDGERTPEFVFAIDTSGSVTEADIRSFATELFAAIEVMNPEKTHILWFDTQCWPQVFEEPPTIQDLHPVGGGGTDYRPIGDYIKEHVQDLSGLVVLTDGECSRYFEEPDFPVLWVITKRRSYYYHEPPFGSVIYLTNQ